jgi:hypothetical protein
VRECARRRSARAHPALLEEDLDHLPVASTSRSIAERFVALIRARDGEQAEEAAARHEALLEEGCTRRSGLVSMSVIAFIGGHSVPPVRESMIAAAGAWPPPSSSEAERARAHALDRPSPVLAAGKTHADEINMSDLIPAAFFQPSPAPASAPARRSRRAGRPRARPTAARRRRA